MSEAAALASPTAASPGAPSVAAPADLAVAAPSPPVQRSLGVKAGEWDDNANYRDFLAYIGAAGGIEKLNVSNRQFVVVEDAQGKGVPNCALKISEGETNVSLVTMASGRAILFPKAHNLSSNTFKVSATCGSKNATATGTIDASEPDGVTRLKLSASRVEAQKPVVELAFVLDTTGSMSEEIESVKETLDKVVKRFDNSATIRVGLVEYKDKGDSFVTKVYPFTTDLVAFRKQIDGISASGGGDTPEDVNSGLAATLSELKWSADASSRLAFLIADAPPHLDYPNGVPYSASAKKAAAAGIKVHTISASGMDDVGQAVFRQVAQFTGGSNMFVLRGGAGPQSAGAGDVKSSCGPTHDNFTSGNLDELIIRKVKLELAALKANPLSIAGLGQDENAKPCEKRVLLVAD